MLFYLSHLINIWGPFRLFSYVTFRSGGAAATAFFLVILLGPLTIRVLKRVNTTAPSRHKGLIPDEFIDESKDKVPTMGGVLIIASIVVSTLLWANPTNQIMFVFLFLIISLCIVGFIDDYAKVVHRNRDGISGKLKLIAQFAIAIIAVGYLALLPKTEVCLSQFMVPFVTDPVLTGFYGTLVTIPLGILVVIGSSNAVNLTDGKDGLAIGSVIFCALAYTGFAYITGNTIFAKHLNLHYIAGAGEIGIFSAAIIGAGIGFLWYNCQPASTFMGDTGSLALGGSIGLIAVLVRQELILLLIGGVFVMEAGSVIIQVCVYKLTGKRVFLCAPIHHHFERKGWTENQIVIRFWILAGLFALMGLASLKLR